MMNCLQSPDETIWQHCQNVSQTYFNLISSPCNYCLPPIIKENWNFLIQHQASPQIVKDYLEWHDCGKPACLSIKDGRASFPNHAAISEKLFRDAGGSPESAKLISLDMIFHTSKPAEILALQLGKQTICTLMLSAWAALFSNAKMFGGTDSESFKIKYSQMVSRCKKVLKNV